MSDFEVLGEIIPDFPATRVMLMTDRNSSLTQWLVEFIKQREASLDIRALNKKCFDAIEKLKLDENKLVTLEYLDESSQRYNPHGYKLDTFFLYLEDETQDKEHLLTRVYASMKNAGGVVIIVSNENSLASAIELDLDEANFVAINPIDILKTHRVFYAKKMHGWDGAR